MEKETIKALCPNCGGLRNSTVHGYVQTKWEDPIYPMYAYYHHHLLQCNGCDVVFYQLNENFSEHTTYEEVNGESIAVPIDMITTYPALETSRYPDWLPRIEGVDSQLFQIFNEMYTSYKNNNFILSSIGLRTIFDRTTEFLNIHPGFALGDKVKKLQSEGYIGDTEARVLSSVIDAGNAAAHRSWSPKKAEFEQLLEVIEGFVQRAVLGKKSLEHITQNLPPRPKKPKS